MTVADFHNQFEVLVATLLQLPESTFKGGFLNGIRNDLRVKVKLLQLADLNNVMLLAQQVEKCNSTLERLKEMKGWAKLGN